MHTRREQAPAPGNVPGGSEGRHGVVAGESDVQVWLTAVVEHASQQVRGRPRVVLRRGGVAAGQRGGGGAQQRLGPCRRVQGRNRVHPARARGRQGDREVPA